MSTTLKNIFRQDTKLISAWLKIKDELEHYSGSTLGLALAMIDFTNAYENFLVDKKAIIDIHNKSEKQKAKQDPSYEPKSISSEGMDSKADCMEALFTSSKIYLPLNVFEDLKEQCNGFFSYQCNNSSPIKKKTRKALSNDDENKIIRDFLAIQSSMTFLLDSAIWLEKSNKKKWASKIIAQHALSQENFSVFRDCFESYKTSVKNKQKVAPSREHIQEKVEQTLSSFSMFYDMCCEEPAFSKREFNLSDLAPEQKSNFMNYAKIHLVQKEKEQKAQLQKQLKQEAFMLKEMEDFLKGEDLPEKQIKQQLEEFSKQQKAIVLEKNKKPTQLNNFKVSELIDRCLEKEKPASKMIEIEKTNYKGAREFEEYAEWYQEFEKEDGFIKWAGKFMGKLYTYTRKHPDPTVFHDRHHHISQLMAHLNFLVLEQRDRTSIDRVCDMLLFSEKLDYKNGELHEVIVKMRKKILAFRLTPTELASERAKIQLLGRSSVVTDKMAEFKKSEAYFFMTTRYQRQKKDLEKEKMLQQKSQKNNPALPSDIQEEVEKLNPFSSNSFIKAELKEYIRKAEEKFKKSQTENPSKPDNFFKRWILWLTSFFPEYSKRQVRHERIQARSRRSVSPHGVKGQLHFFEDSNSSILSNSQENLEESSSFHTPVKGKQSFH